MRLKSQDSSTDARNDKERSVWNSFHRVILSLSKDPIGSPVILSEVRLSLRYAEGSHGSSCHPERSRRIPSVPVSS
jgi:hypothetical protein